jgi:hypothetical protein
MTLNTSTSGNTTTYTYDVSVACGTASAVDIALPVQQAHSLLANSPAGMCNMPYSNSENMAHFGIGAVCPGGPAAPSFPFKFTLTAPSPGTSAVMSRVQYKITKADKTILGQDFTAVPTDDAVTAQPVAVNPTNVDLLLGAGSHLAGAIPVDYTVVTNSVLAATGVGRAVPVLLGGLGFTFSKITAQKKRDWKAYLPNTAFVSLQFPTSSSSASSGAINGYTFGAAYKVQTYLELMIGYSLSPEMEPAYGFRQAAAQTVTNNPTVPIYQRYSATAILANQPDSLDGFPLLLQTSNGQQGGPIYPGTVLETHYRGGLFVGVAFPFSLLGNAKEKP